MHFLSSRLEQERFTKMNRNSVNISLIDVINISIESFKLLLNEINQIENKKSFIIIIIIIHKDAFLSNLMRRRRVRIGKFILAKRTQKALLVNNSNISLLFPPDTFMVITFAGALRQDLAYCVHLNSELFSCADGTHAAAAGH